MQIRRAEASDEQALFHIRQRAILELAIPVIQVEEAEQWAMSAALDRVARAIAEHEVWIAVEDKIIGWIEIDHNRIAALYVLPAVARHGVGSSLLAFAEIAISKASYTTVHLDASQNAREFYLRRGYIQTGSQKPDGSWPLAKELVTFASR